MRLNVVFSFALAVVLAGAARAVSVGESPDLKFSTIDGKEIDLKDYRGRIVVIDYFASYCPVCNREGAKKKALADKYTQGVDFIGVAADKGKRTHKKLDTFIIEKSVTWPVTNDSLIVDALGVKTFSTDTIIDPDGRVAWQGVSFDLEQHLQQTIRATPPVVLPQKEIDAALAAAKTAASQATSGDLVAAVKTLKDAPADAHRLGMTAKALDDADAAVQKVAAAHLEKADASSAAGDYTVAIASYKQLEKEVPAGPSGKAARAKLDALQSNPKAAKAFVVVANEERAEAVLAAVQKSIDAKRKPAAIVQLNFLIKKYPTTPAAAKAKTLLATLEAPATQPAKT